MGPRRGAMKRLIPRLITTSTSRTRLLIEPFGRFNFRRMSLGVKYTFPTVTGGEGKYNVLPCPRRIGSLLRVVRQRPSVSFSMGVQLKCRGISRYVRLLPVLGTSYLSHVIMRTHAKGRRCGRGYS